MNKTKAKFEIDGLRGWIEVAVRDNTVSIRVDDTDDFETSIAGLDALMTVLSAARTTLYRYEDAPQLADTGGAQL